MAESTPQKTRLKDFPRTYWVVILFEFFERGSYYGMMSILSVYMTDQLGFSKEGVGVIKSTIQPLLYFLPILSGAVADRMGYRKTLMVAFTLLGGGYFLTSQMDTYAAVFFSLVIMGLGAGTFKPVVSGTIAKVTDERTSTLGFGIFYWTINLGAFLFPLILVPMLKAIAWHYVIIASAIGTGAMLLPTIFLFKEPTEKHPDKESFTTALKGIVQKLIMVFTDWRFILFIFIYSWFWILYFQMFDSVLWYVKAFVDASPLNNWVQGTFGIDWHFDVEHVTVINAGTIILLQLFISKIVSKTKALPTMVTGIALGTIGMAILAFDTNIWVFMVGIIVFSIGEMTAHPKFISYLGLIAPPDKKATYMGFGFLYGAFGSLIGGVLGAFLYVRFIDNPMIEYIRHSVAERTLDISLPPAMKIDEALAIGEQIGLTKADISQYAMTSELWLLFSGIGVICIIGLLTYQKFIGTRTGH
ncbi:MAG: MFS transporter [Bacteroidetes bacterium]|nr:MFS transporter [Bacteroidota bacterium]